MTRKQKAKEFRKKGDPRFVITREEPAPEGFTTIIADNVMVTGVQAGGYEKSVAAFIKGKNRKIILEPEPDNPVDKNATKVIGEWRGRFFITRTAQLGYVESKVNKKSLSYYRDRPMAATITKLLKPRRRIPLIRKRKSPGIRMDIWVQ